MTTIAATARSIDDTIAHIQLTDPNLSSAVAWGWLGCSPDGYTILAADDRDAAERLRRNIRFAQQRMYGRGPDYQVVWGSARDVHAFVYANR